MKCLSLFFAIVILILLDSCKCYEGFDLDREFFIGFGLFDKATGENLLEITSKYDRDSVQVYNENGVEVYIGPVPLNGRVYFGRYGYEFEEIPLHLDVTEYYFLHLRNQGLDIDTFKLEYRARIGECNEKEFTYLNFYYNEELVYESQNPADGFDVDLYK